jgi:hypothetical protein
MTAITKRWFGANIRRAGKTLSLEYLERREPLAGDVSAFIADGSITVTGDGAANEISISRTSATSVTILGVGTKINGDSNPLTLAGFSKDLIINLGGGDDIVRLAGSGSEPLGIGGNLTLRTNDGNDQIHLADVSVTGNATLDAGAGHDFMTASASASDWGLRVARTTSIATGDGVDQVRFDQVQFLDRVAVSMAGGNNQLVFTNASFAKLLTAGGGAGNDELRIANGTFGQSPVFNSFETQSINAPETPPGEPAGEGSSSGVSTITQNLTLVVATTGDNTIGDGTVSRPWASIQRAIDYLADKTIAANATVTISVQNGTYQLSHAIQMQHVSGTRIRLVGNTTNESLVVLHFTNNSDGLYLSDGCALGLVDGFTFRGNWLGSGTAGLGTSGIRASQNASISLGDHMAVKNFYYGVQADRSGVVEADLIKISDVGDAGLFAYSGGVIDATRATIVRAVDTTRNLGGGVVAEIGGIIRCNFLTATDCLKAGIQAIGGNVRADSFNVSGNRRYGVFVERNGILDSDGPSYANNNGSHGIYLKSGGVLQTFSGMTANGNGGSGLFAWQGRANIDSGAHFNGNDERGIYASSGSSIVVFGGGTMNNNRLSGVEAFGSSYVDVQNCTITGNLAKGLHALLGSTIYAKGATVSFNGQNLGIPANTLSSDGSLIKTS